MIVWLTSSHRKPSFALFGRCAGQHVLESANIPLHMPTVASALEYAMALLDGDSAYFIGAEFLGPVDLEKDGERAEALGESVNLDLEELLSICEDSVSARASSQLLPVCFRTFVDVDSVHR